MIARFHYDAQTLKRLLHDEPGNLDREVRTHVETCELCQDQLDALSAGDMTWDEICELMRQDDLPDSIRMETQSQPKPRVRFLETSEVPNALGRFGRYDILEILGRGGMGIVLRGIDSALDRPCAIKVLAPELASSAAARKRFFREARSAAAVVHPHVVPIQTVDEHDGLPYLVMPVVEGQSLQQRVDRNGPLDVIEVLRIAGQIADGLSAAHSQGLVHRDIKPANVLLENDVERVQITDFGLARAVDDASMTRSGVIAGTPQYMSPEQAHGDTIDHRSDLFSLGSVMFFMLTGRSPFRAETSMGVLNRICHDQPRSLRRINAEVPQWLERIVVRLLEKSPDDRFQTAEEVANLLAKRLTEMNNPDSGSLTAPAGAEPQSDPPHSAFANPPNRLRRFLLAAGFAFVALAGILIYLQTNQGTLRIESNSDVDVPIRIMNGEKTVEQLTVSKQGATTRLNAGQYVIEVDDDDSHVELQGDRFTLRRGDTWIVAITPAKESLGSGSKLEGSSMESGSPMESPGSPAPAGGGGRLMDKAAGQTHDKSEAEEGWRYFQWDGEGNVTISRWYAESLGLDRDQQEAVDKLLREAWQSYIALERNATHFSRMETGGIFVEIQQPGEELAKVRSRLRSQLRSLLRESVAESIYSVALNRHLKEPDDTWPDAADAYPSILGWAAQNYPVKLQITYHQGKVHWWIRPGKHGVTGVGSRLPPELEHYFWIDKETDQAVPSANVSDVPGGSYILPRPDSKQPGSHTVDYSGEYAQSFDSQHSTAVEKEIARKRLDVLKQQVKVLEARYKAGEVGFDQRFPAMIELLNAELQLAKTAEERLRNLQQQASVLRDFEQALIQKHVAGLITSEQVLSTKADRIAAEARLESEQSHTCPMHSQIDHLGPGRCPICGMELVTGNASAPPRDATDRPSTDDSQNADGYDRTFLSKLQGQWQVEMQAYDDEKLQSSKAHGRVMGNRITFTGDDGIPVSFAFAYVSDGPPKQIDLRPMLTADERQQLFSSGEIGAPPQDLVNPVFHAIVEEHQGGFRFCLPATPGERPTEFSVSTDLGLWIFRPMGQATPKPEASPLR
ncbi:protein kinase [Roseiconus nitratireducens]|uniref:non-specific serine/threonine protein kinase n=1 Tax=Roseiconus nitratireducens TaxID=2605748 RepID=A0A5M6CTD9_9BACT|nr:protein kinase [Roseiconus nitratireducens]KAA5538517.1 protein kinase [Roseiconus nitratireducens]